jgi:hypothetical protein
MSGNTVAIHNVLKKKTTKLNSQLAQYKKKIKSTRIILETIIKKTIWENTIAIHSVLKKKIIKLNYQPAQY